MGGKTYSKKSLKYLGGTNLRLGYYIMTLTPLCRNKVDTTKRRLVLYYYRS